MKRLREKIAIARSAADTQSGIEAYVASLRGEDGASHLHLRLPVNAVGALGLSLDREVRVEAQRGRDDENLNDVIRIHWSVPDTGLFPTFDGVLVVWAQTDGKGSFVELDGQYKPPLGAPGEAFDDLIGHGIAQLTAREFLADLKRAVERVIA